MNIPVCGLSINDGSAVTQALTTAAGAVVAWNGTGGNAAPIPTDGAMRADKTNSRLLVPVGYYAVEVDLTLVGGGTADVIAQITRNGVAVADGSVRVGVTTARANLSASCLIQVTPANVPGTIAAFPEPNDPAPAYVGAGGAPLSMCPIQVTLATVASTVTVTIEAGHFTAWKIG